MEILNHLSPVSASRYYFTNWWYYLFYLLKFAPFGGKTIPSVAPKNYGVVKKGDLRFPPFLKITISIYFIEKFNGTLYKGKKTLFFAQFIF